MILATGVSELDFSGPASHAEIELRLSAAPRRFRKLASTSTLSTPPLFHVLPFGQMVLMPGHLNQGSEFTMLSGVGANVNSVDLRVVLTVDLSSATFL